MQTKLQNGFDLFPHQKEVISWMKKRENEESWGIRGGIISLSMGLGKTLTALTYSFQNKGLFPSLVVTSKTVMNEWKDEVSKFFCSAKVLYLHKEYIEDITKIDRNEIMKYDIVITTYDVCLFSCRKGKYFIQCLEFGKENSQVVAIHLREQRDSNIPNLKGTAVIYGTPWERVICDESQRFANPTTMTYKCMMAIYGRHKWCLTGTPIRNYETDIWAQLRFCGYRGIEKIHEWKRDGCVSFKDHNLISAFFLMSYYDAKMELPEKIEKDVIIELEGHHKEIYTSVLNQTREMYYNAMANSCSYSSVLAMFTRLRQCAIAPYLIIPESKRGKNPAIPSRLWCIEKTGWAGMKSPKIVKIIDIIRTATKDNPNCNSDVQSLSFLAKRALYANFDSRDIKKLANKISLQIDHPTKLIVFSMFTSCLDLLREAINESYPEFKFVQIDGDSKNRAALIEQFKTDIKIQGMFLTYKVGSEGLNLSEATHCICIEPWWTNAVHNQAKGRLWRTGQTKKVYIHNVIVKCSVEEKIVEICKAKDDMARSYLEGTERKLRRPGLDKYTLGKMLGITM
jgi:SNF2 family DNA or RNA helicase